MERYHNNWLNNKFFRIFVFVLVFGFTRFANAEKPVWTAEDTVSLPTIVIYGVSSDGQYTLCGTIIPTCNQRDDKVSSF